MSLQALKARFFKIPVLSCILSGLVFSVSFLNEYMFAFAFAGLYLLFLIIQSGEKKSRFRHIFSFYMGLLPVVYSWFAKLYPFEGFGFTKVQGVLIVIAGVIGASIYHALVISLVFMLTKLIPKSKDYLYPLGLGFVFVIYEWFLNIGPLKFSWATVAITQTKFAPLLQTASLFGAYFITFVVAVFCGYLALFTLKRKKAYLKTGVLSLLIPLIAGSVLLALPTKAEAKINSAVIQGNALSNEKWESDKLASIVNTYISLTEQEAKKGADVIVLPESAFPIYFTENGTIHTKLSSIAKEHDCVILSGVLIDDGGKKNSMIAIRPDGSLTNYYVKRNLVPFGETLPFEDLTLKITELMGMNLSRINYVKGNSSEIISVNGVNYGGIVCYDSIFPSTVRESVNDGANLLVVVTNDSWYKDAAAVYQHVWHATLRAVENGRYIVRAANTGVSCFITPKGQVINPTQVLTESTSSCDVYTVSSKTLYTYIGDVILYIAFGFYIVLTGVTVYEKYKALSTKHTQKQ